MRRLKPKGFIESSTLGVTIMNGRVGLQKLITDLDMNMDIRGV